MSTSLSVAGLIWALASFVAAAIACVGYFMPFWLVSSHAELTRTIQQLSASFGTFRRCGSGLPLIQVTSSSTGLTSTTVDSSPMIFADCGRYATFGDIPSVWWQVTTVVVGVGCCTGLLVAFAALACCCIDDVMSRSVARVAFVVQLMAGVCVAVGCVLYPLGWDNREVRQYCGDAADQFKPGSCKISWAFWTTVAGSVSLLFCSALALRSAKRQGGYQRAPIRP